MAKASLYPTIPLGNLTGAEFVFLSDSVTVDPANNLILDVLVQYAEANITGFVTDASNIGIGGIGTFKALNGSILEFYNLRPLSSKITITLNGGNNTVDFDITESALNLNNLSGVLDVTKGGLGSVAVPTNGQIPIGNGSDYVTGNVISGQDIITTNGPGTLQIDSNFTKGHVNNGGLTYLSSTMVTVNAGEFRDNADTFDIILGVSQSLNLGIVGANGLDAGVQTANTWYATYVIADSTAINPVATLASLSFSSPTLPTGYDTFFYNGAIRSNSGNVIRLFTETGTGKHRKYYWEDNVGESTVLILGNALVFTPVSLASVVPETSRIAILNFFFDSNSGGVTDSFYFRQTGLTTTIANSINSFSPGVKSQSFRGQSIVITDSSQSIDYAVDNASDDLTLSVFSFEEEL